MVIVLRLTRLSRVSELGFIKPIISILTRPANSRSELEIDHPSIKYRRDIDGIRAVSILLILIFHAFPETLTGGFVGVDVFFVISGYLISTIITKQNLASEFSFRNFYARRIRRIFPALFLILFATPFVGWITLLGPQFVRLGRQLTWGAVFYSNFGLRTQAGYFDPNAEFKPLIHLWSLAIEEQFYVVWPLLSWIAFKRRFNILWLVIGLAATSFTLSMFEIKTDRTGDYYVTWFRLWELLIGVFLAQSSIFTWSGALRSGKPAIAHSRLILEAASVIGALALLGSAIVLDSNSRFPGWRAAFPTIGAALIIWAGPSAWINRRILSHPVMVGIGLISYPLYLWHWPILSILHLTNTGALPFETRMTAIALAVGLAYATYRFIETPIRRGQIFSRWGFVASAAASLSVALLGIAISNELIKARATLLGVDRVAVAMNEWDFPTKAMQRINFEGWSIYKLGNGPKTTLFIGDSNMQQYAPRIDTLLSAGRDPDRSAVFITAGGCPPIPHMVEIDHAGCAGLIDVATDYAEQNKIDSIVVGAAWWGYLASTSYRLERPGLSGNFKDLAIDNRLFDELESWLGRLKGSGRRLYIVLNIPVGLILGPQAIVHRTWWGGFYLAYGGVSVADLQRNFGELNRKFFALGSRVGATVIDPLQYLCSNGLCPSADEQGEPMYKDAAHLRPTYVRAKVTYLDEVLRN